MLLSETDVTEVLLALPDGNDTSTLLKNLHDELLCGVLWQTTHKHRLTARGSLSGGRGREVFEDQKHIRRLHYRRSFLNLLHFYMFILIIFLLSL